MSWICFAWNVWNKGKAPFGKVERRLGNHAHAVEELPLMSKLSFYKLAFSLPPFCCVFAYSNFVYGYTLRVRAWEMVGYIPQFSSLKLSEWAGERRLRCWHLFSPPWEPSNPNYGVLLLVLVALTIGIIPQQATVWSRFWKAPRDVAGRWWQRELVSCRLRWGSNWRMAMQHLLRSWASRFVTTVQALVTWEAPVLSPWLC